MFSNRCVEVEQTLLAGLICGSQSMDYVQHIICSSDFVGHTNRLVFNFIRAQFAGREEFDLGGLIHEIETAAGHSRADAIAYLSEIIQLNCPSRHCLHYAVLLRQQRGCAGGLAAIEKFASAD